MTLEELARAVQDEVFRLDTYESRRVVRAVVLALAEDDDLIFGAFGRDERWLGEDETDALKRRRALIAEARAAAPDPS